MAKVSLRHLGILANRIRSRNRKGLGQCKSDILHDSPAIDGEENGLKQSYFPIIDRSLDNNQVTHQTTTYLPTTR